MTAGRTVNSQRQDWGTPPKYVKAVLNVLQKIELDPCSNSSSIVPADVKYIFPQNDGLKDSWDYSTIFVNPPYGRNSQNKTSIADWLNRCTDANRRFGAEIIALVPVATNTRHWKDNIFKNATAVCFLADTRLKFLVNGVEGKKGAPMACAMIYWGEDADKFIAIFSQYGFIVNINERNYEIS